MAIAHCLTIAGSDPSGGAGIQADLKTFAAFGTYGMAVITALTAQNTAQVTRVHAPPADFVREQLRVTLQDVRCDAAKTGMLYDAAIIEAVSDVLRQTSRMPLVVDPVMISTSGARLLQQDAVKAMKEQLLPLALLATPNIPEAELLAGGVIEDKPAMIEAARIIASVGPRAVLIKGGHLEEESPVVTDLLWTPSEQKFLESERFAGRVMHGAGCTLSAAICSCLARGLKLAEAVEHGRDYVAAAIAHAFAVGSGAMPLNHLVTPPTFSPPSPAS